MSLYSTSISTVDWTTLSASGKSDLPTPSYDNKRMVSLRDGDITGRVERTKSVIRDNSIAAGSSKVDVAQIRIVILKVFMSSADAVPETGE